ncbi:choice-of-anchor L domain-containing protein [Gaetbulibacter sp. M240]|uniref:T9SS type B sorting domain-containing protein n=1 Tax=Gaetbulibacter sp. M240 TaxID=3126511 RepID=UPI00374E658D
MKFVQYLTALLICSISYLQAQQINVDNTVPLEPLIQNNLVSGCVDISNISSSVNGNGFGFPSYGYFERGSSNFPFENGIILSTGDASKAGNSAIGTTLNDGYNTGWGTDPDIEPALNVTSTENATSIEFDLVSISSQFQFNFLFASEDYEGVTPCQVSDGFVFLIRPTGSVGPYQNIALVPGTSDGVSTGTVHPDLSPACGAQNASTFGGFNVGDTNYTGRTDVFTATTTIQPNVSYHIKLIIADQYDGRGDSAVFIEGNSIDILDLGEDISTCSGNVVLDANINNALASYAWYLDGALLAGETNPILNATQSGTYRVDVTVPLNGTDCTETDEIIVVLNSTEYIEPITDYLVCDDNNPGDEREFFDLSTKNAELAANITFSNNYTFSYHFSEPDARNNTNAITTPIENTINPQPIFVRVEDLDSGCFAYTTFDLAVTPLPVIIAPTPLEVCDTDDTPNGFTVIDLTFKNNEITNGDPNLMVSYYASDNDARNGINPLPETSYMNVLTPTDLVYARVVDIQTGCANITPLDINITISPVVNRDIQYIDACDTDHNGNAIFDLTQVRDNVLQGATGVTVNYHESFDDAQNGINPISDPTSYEYTDPNAEPGFAVLYMSIQDNTTGCISVVEIQAHTNLLLTATRIEDYALCDSNDDQNDTQDFNLNTIQMYISNELPYNITVTFFETQTDRDNNVNAIDKSILFAATNPTTLYIRIDNGSCSEVSQLDLLVNPILLFQPANPVPYCDDDADGIVDIDLHSLDDLVTGGNTDFVVTYYGSQYDADNAINPLPDFYTNTDPIETIYARIENTDSQCRTVNPFEIEILVAPEATDPSPIVVCDDDQDGFSIVNLSDKISEIVTDPSIVDIEFFTTQANAEAATNPIPNNQLTAFNAQTQTIFIRVESNENDFGCYNLVTLEVIVNTLPIIPDISNFQICLDDGSTTTQFYMRDKDLEILNGQSGKEVHYFEDAALTSEIDKDNPYTNTSSPQTIYVRVENTTDPSCNATGSFILQVSADPIYNTPTAYITCDDSSNDQVEEFDLNQKLDEMKAGLANPDDLNISFHLSYNDADNNLNPISLTYSNISNPQSIFVRIESLDSLCHVVEEFTLNIVPAPDVTQVNGPLSYCDNDYDGIVTFNLEDADFQILDRIQSNIIVNYFENLNDINPDDSLDNSNEISDPLNYVSGNRTVFIKIANTLTECYTVIPLDLVVNVPPSTFEVGTIEICDNPTQTFDLTLVDTRLVPASRLPEVNIAYFNTQADAENNTAPIGTTFNYTASNQTLYARLADAVTGCPVVVPFDLQVNPNPVANTAPDLVACDDDFDGTLIFDLSVNTATILGSQSSSTYSVSYFGSQSDADNNIPPLPNEYPAQNGDMIFARVENLNTGCYDTSQFTTFVNPLPVIPVDDVVPLCINRLPLIIDAYTGDPNDTYLWSTGETSSSIQLNSPSDIGDYFVTVTRQNSQGPDCSYTQDFSVIQSENATINFTTKVDFADPNSITIDVSGIGNYVFILDDGEPQQSNVFENVTYGIHQITIRDLNGCEDVYTDVVVIDVPKVVTPNNDNYNDSWHVIGIEEIPGTMVYIYTRYGKLIKTLTHNSMGWDGTFNGKPMPADDYWFVANVLQDGKAFEVKGHFALKR